MLGAYDYIPAPAELTFEAAVTELQRRFPSHLLLPHWLPFADRAHTDQLEGGLRSAGLDVRSFEGTQAELRDYESRADYAGRYPGYHDGNQPEKRFEHYVAMSLLGLGPDDVFIDVAACSSPLPEITARVFGCRSYGQDIMYAAGIQGEYIGGDACDMPVPDGFASAAVLACSLEHFEGDGDTRLFRELGRVLRPGGRVVIVPLYLHLFAAAMTDPRYALNSDGLSFDPDTVLFCSDGWGNRHGRFYSPTTLKRRILEPSRDDFDFEIFRLNEDLCRQYSDPAIYARFALRATRR